MSKIKTREKTRDIKLLDKSAVAGQRMKSAFIRSKNRGEDLADNRQDTPGEYAAGQMEAGLDDLLHDAGTVGAAGAKTAVQKGREAFHRQRAKKAAEKVRAGAATGTPAAPARAHTSFTPPEGSHPPADSPAASTGDGPVPHTREDLITERGRQFARQQAAKRAETPGQIRNSPVRQNQSAMKTREIASPPVRTSPPRDTEHAATSVSNTVKRPVRNIKQAKQSIGRAVNTPARPAVKTARPIAKVQQGTKAAIKTVERPSKTAIKTAQATAKASQRAAHAAAKAARMTAQTARATAKTAAASAKAAAMAVAAAVKAIIAGTKALIAAIAAGGGVAALVIVVICLIGLVVGSCFGIFFSNEDSGTGQTMQTAVQEINADYQETLDGIKASHNYDVLEMSGSRAVWKEVLAVYAVKTTTDPDNAQEVATMDDGKLELLRDIFWQMNEISSSTSTRTETVVETSDDGNGNVVETEATVTQTYLYITVSHKTAQEMADQFGFNEDQLEHMAELLADENNSLWSQILYGTTGGDGEIVAVALSQVGNIGGQPYWSWYGFSSRVDWCACFVSWCAEQCGYLEMGVIPRFAGCIQGSNWFKSRGLWQDGSYEPRPGDIIFFDWEGDGIPDHVGIVEKVENGRVHTVEGNSGDMCRQNSYPVGSAVVYGYGCPAY